MTQYILVEYGKKNISAHWLLPWIPALIHKAWPGTGFGTYLGGVETDLCEPMTVDGITKREKMRRQCCLLLLKRVILNDQVPGEWNKNRQCLWSLDGRVFAVDRVLAGTVFNVKPNLQKQVMQQLSITCKVMVDWLSSVASERLEEGQCRWWG